MTYIVNSVSDNIILLYYTNGFYRIAFEIHTNVGCSDFRCDVVTNKIYNPRNDNNTK